MLSLKRLQIAGFGPFADPQVIEFPPEDGVTIIYGENMRGKTSLLNAVRYAFYGRVIGRGSRARRMHDVCNRELVSQGKYRFSVGLTFDFDNEEYELQRSCSALGREPPTDDTGYEQTVDLRHENRILSAHERERVLAQALPEQVSRFFLFDGELLQEYEELLHNESEAGRKISESIERILGVPLLKRGRLHLSSLAEDASAAAAREAKKSDETSTIGTALEGANNMQRAHREELDRQDKALLELQEQRKEAEAYLQSKERYAAILQERDRCERRISQVTTEIGSAQSDLQTVMRDAWRSLLAGPVRSARREVAAEASEQVDKLIPILRRKAIETGTCGTCDRAVDSGTAARLRATVSDVAGIPADLSAVIQRMTDLGGFSDRDLSQSVKQLHERLRSLHVEEVSVRLHVKDLNQELGDADVERVRSSTTSLTDVTRKITLVEQAIVAEQSKLTDVERNIVRLNERLGALGSPNSRAAHDRSEYLRSALRVFERSVDRYKQDLRARVELTATKLFLQMTTEREDYKGLAINSGYGLDIVHRAGGTEAGRSAGAEHVIALALMGALQGNASLKGPIVMDSPFGRLDQGHRVNVVKTVPTMASQVVLLVHEAEVRRKEARELLGGRLLREYELVRKTARRSVIQLVEA